MSRASRCSLSGLIVLVLLLAAGGWVAGQEGSRPRQIPAFTDALEKMRFRKWQEAAEKLGKALAWNEDGEVIRVYANQYVPYLPHLYMGRVLLELGCYDEALAHLDRSVLRDATVRRLASEKEAWERLRAEVEERKNRSPGARRREKDPGVECSDYNPKEIDDALGPPS